MTERAVAFSLQSCRRYWTLQQREHRKGPARLQELSQSTAICYIQCCTAELTFNQMPRGSHAMQVIQQLPYAGTGTTEGYAQNYQTSGCTGSIQGSTAPVRFPHQLHTYRQGSSTCTFKRLC